MTVPKLLCRGGLHVYGVRVRMTQGQCYAYTWCVHTCMGVLLGAVQEVRIVIEVVGGDPLDRQAARWGASVSFDQLSFLTAVSAFSRTTLLTWP